MSKGKVLSVAFCLSLAVVSSAWAQNQPWSAPNGAVESRLDACTVGFTPLNRVAMDDFQYGANTTIKKIRWWGVVLDPANAQLTKRFFIAIWGNATAGPCPAGCNPTNILANWCLAASTAVAGQDCNGRTVYRFTVCIPAPFFTALAGTKYWLQISEIDTESARVGVEDFRWSGYRYPEDADHTRLCDAQQRAAGPVSICTIFDDCVPAVETDLSYKLYTSCLVVVVPPIIVAPIGGLAEIRPLSAPAGPPIMVEAVHVDESGEVHLDVDVPDGQYEVRFIGMGMARPKAQLSVMGGVGVSSFFDVFVGDLNNDGQANGNDVQPLIDGLLHP
jgi:hypothetical protein